MLYTATAVACRHLGSSIAFSGSCRQAWAIQGEPDKGPHYLWFCSLTLHEALLHAEVSAATGLQHLEPKK